MFKPARGRKGKRTRLPKDELWQLYRAAYEQYQCEILNGEKAYHRYVNDFFYSHLPIIVWNEADWQEHTQNVYGLLELLKDRRDLVKAFFSKDVFEKKDFEEMRRLFDTGKSLNEKPVVLAHLSDKELELITEFVNSKDIFTMEVTASAMKKLFTCNLEIPLQASNNRNVALFFGALCQYHFIPHRWENIMAKNKLVSSSSDNVPLKASQLSNALSQAKEAMLLKDKTTKDKKDDVGFGSLCEAFAKKLKESL